VSVIHPAVVNYATVAAAREGTASAVCQVEMLRVFRADVGLGAYAFLPRATETFGRLAQSAMQLLTHLTGMGTKLGNFEKGRIVDNALRELSVDLC
jgi:hypothetical protein